MIKALFLDRDGIINKDKKYLHRPEDVEFVDGIFSLLTAAKELGYELFIITNQAGVAKGYYSEADVLSLHRWMAEKFADKGIVIRDFFYCPHHPDFTGECGCRKPAPGMILAAAERYGINLSESAVIGDKNSDILAGANAGTGRKILVNSEYIKTPAPEADIFVQNLSEAEKYLRECA